VETQYTVRAGKSSSFSHTVKTTDQEFEVSLSDQTVGLDAMTTPGLDARVQRAFRFVADPDTSTTIGGQPAGRRGARGPRLLGQYPRENRGALEVYGGCHWELQEPLPVDLAFEAEYEAVDSGAVVKGAPIYSPRGTTATAAINPLSYRGLSGLEKPGVYHFRVHLTPSRDVALSYPECQAFWNGVILTSPDIKLRVAEFPPAKKP
jgi:hypothetical protein